MTRASFGVAFVLVVMSILTAVQGISITAEMLASWLLGAAIGTVLYELGRRAR